jgi:hypothetical protein
MEPNNRMNDLIVITGNLADLLQRENTALREHDAREVRKLLDEKATLSRIYEMRYKGLSENPDIIDSADMDVRNQLKTLSEQVQGLMDENTKLLRAELEVNKRVVEMIAEAVRKQQPSAGTYGAKAVTSEDGAHAADRRLALSLDQTL